MPINWPEILKANKEVTKTKVYKKIMSRLGYFEKFIKDPKTKNLSLMLKQLVISHLTKDPTMEINPSGEFFQPELIICSKDSTSRVRIGTHGIGIRCETSRQNTGPSVHIDQVGYNRSDRDKIKQKGVIIECFNIPQAVADTILNDFIKVKSTTRWGVIHRHLVLEELVNCYPRGYLVSAELKDGKNPEEALPGIDQDAVWTLIDKTSGVCIFGNAHRYINKNTEVSISVRVEQKGVEFELPE